MSFEILQHDAGGRLGILYTRHGKIETPAICPVINPNRLVVTPKEMFEMGVQIVMTNSYIIYKDPKLREEALRKGLHDFLDFKGPIIIDNGAYQWHIYGSIDVDALEMFYFQRNIRPDIGILLDYPTSHDMSREKAVETVEVTLENARKCIPLISKKDGILWTGVIQGGYFLDLVAKCAKKMSGLPLDLHALGEPVQFLIEYDFKKVADMLVTARANLRADRPLHLFGAGLPWTLPFFVAMGADLFDSAAYALYAKRRVYMTPAGNFTLDGLTELICECPVCTSYTLSELKKLEPELQEKLLAKHNLYVTITEMRRIREYIRHNRLWELVHVRAHTHPQLLKALVYSLRKYRRYLEKRDLFTKRRAFFWLDDFCKYRPEISRALNRVKMVFGSHTVPSGLRYTYPFYQFESYTDKLPFKLEKKKVSDLEIVRTVADYQFKEKGIGEKIIPENVEITISKKTGRIRSILYEGKLLFVLRAYDYILIPQIEGGRLLKENLPFPRFRVIASKQGVKSIVERKYLPAKYVIGCDMELVPGEQVLIVNESDELIAVGELKFTPEEAVLATRGFPIKVRSIAEEEIV